MIDVTKLPPEIVYKIAVAVDVRPYEAICSMTAYEALDGWLKYEGIIGWTDSILRMVDALRAAELPMEAPQWQPTMKTK